MSGQAQFVVLDATVLSNFAYTNSMDFLVDVFEQSYTAREVVAELEQGVKEGYEFLERALSELPPASLSSTETNYEIAAPKLTSSFVERMSPRLNKKLDNGEARALALALWEIKSVSYRKSDYPVVFASDDGDARTLARELDVQVTGSIGILVHGIREDMLSIETADDWLTSWVEDIGYYSPVDGVEEIL
ncbi:hypothetical protein [Haladaptatus sp. CMAA 1911]|uniref:hypothetical protein n=1 Tax=unclassified Haladaptatus TaxID=2622732 RepID=UPI003754D613